MWRLPDFFSLRAAHTCERGWHGSARESSEPIVRKAEIEAPMNIDSSNLAGATDEDVPFTPVDTPTGGDRAYVSLATAAASVSLIIVGATTFYLIDKARPALSAAGLWDFFTTSVWNPSVGRFGVLGLMIGTTIIAAIAMFIAVPLGVSMALFINEYAPGKLRGPLTSMIDLLAALPSLIFGMWAFFALQEHLTPIAHFLSTRLAVVPFLRADNQSLTQSSFIAGVVVAIMTLPIITSVSRDVMAQVPREQCEGALALGSTRWAMIRSVVLPYARSGIVGASLLGFGRALGETIAVALVISIQFRANTHILTTGGGSIAAHIATAFGEAGPLERSALVAAGLALFLLTFAVNFLARLIVVRTVGEG
jgi:phosphate transport system permease protein